MTDENHGGHIVLPLKYGKRSIIIISPVETSSRVEPVGAPLRPHPTDGNTVFDTIRRGPAEIRAEICEQKLPALAPSSTCVFSHHLAIAVRSQHRDDTVMLLGPGWWQIVRRRDGVPSSITTRTGDPMPTLAAELTRSPTPVTVIAESPSLPVCAGTVVWYPYETFARHRAVRRLNLVLSTRRSVRRIRLGATIALIWFVVATTLSAQRSPTSLEGVEFIRPPDGTVVAEAKDPPDSTVAQELLVLAQKLEGRFEAKRIEYAEGVFTATGILTRSTPAEIARAGLELRRVDVSDTTTRVVVAYAGHGVESPTHTTVVGGESFSTRIRSIAESHHLDITALRHIDDDELVVAFSGQPDRILSVLFATDHVARVVRFTIEPTDNSVQMVYTVASRGSHGR